MPEKNCYKCEPELWAEKASRRGETLPLCTKHYKEMTMPEKHHKPGCKANMNCLVYHPDGVCPGPYGKCTCDAMPDQEPKPECEERFGQYCDDGYSGGKHSLRCTECDRKYRGEPAIIQLCPVCNASTAIQEAVKEERRRISERVNGMRFEDDLETSERNEAIGDVLAIINPKK